jgi:signal transduction histidine kinase
MLEACEVEGKCIHYPLEKWKGLWALALIEKRSLFTNQAPPVPPGHPIIHNNLAAPILYHGEAIGLLNLANKEGGYTEEDQNNLDILASRIAPVLYAWIQRKLREDERKQAEEVMAARNLELQDANKELEAFIYSVSHDLRAPIRHMAGFAQFLAEDCADKLDEQGNIYLSRIQAGSEKATRLIDDMLRLSRISRQEMNRIDMDLNGKALEVIAELRETSPGRDVQIRVAPGLKAAADPSLVGVILANLLGNAWKFTAKTENASIEFGAINQEGKTVFFVKDNGAGFDPAFAEKMFWPFQRLHSEQEFEGTGIGLAIVERIIRRHGGKVWAEGEVGKGAVVYFTLG